MLTAVRYDTCSKCTILRWTDSNIRYVHPTEDLQGVLNSLLLSVQ